MLLEALVLAAAVTCPVEFERQYINTAWGYVNQRCLVDSNGQVWFDRGDQRPSKVRRVDHDEYRIAVALTQMASTEPIKTSMVGVDMGDVTWSYRVNGEPALLKIRGNFTGGPATSAAKDLSELIDKWCEGEPGFPASIAHRP